ncbi:RNA 2',3'-cyclic phosphodiesterase [Bacteroidota bacterium]
MSKKRLFIGTFIDTSLLESLYKEIKEDFNNACTGKWVETENLHFTYKFLGAVEENNIPEITESIRDFLKTYYSNLTLKDLGVFPNPNRPSVLFAKIFNPDNVITDNQKLIDIELAKFGFEKEKRKYTPHLTLRRIKTSTSYFKDILNDYRNIDIGTMTKFSINLVESRLTNQGPVYTILQ